jgi:hypothetical protein
MHGTESFCIYSGSVLYQPIMNIGKAQTVVSKYVYVYISPVGITK